MAKTQIKSRKRVQDHGEVFTNEREVNAMLDMVKAECERLDSRFLEPACGDGNFLVEILNRKLDVVDAISRDDDDWMSNAFHAAASIYGVELLQDNTIECKMRMVRIVCRRAIAYGISERVDEDVCNRFANVISYVLRHNILCGDALTLKQADGSPIVFPEWSFVKHDYVCRRDFEFATLLETGAKTGAEGVPKPVKRYRRCKWWDVIDHG